MNPKPNKKLITILEAAGENLLNYWPANNKEDLKQELKADNTLVTEADTTTNTFLLKELFVLDDFSRIYSEETGLTVKQQSECFWYLDPLDGTKQFASGASDFYILLSCINQAGLAIEAYVYQPVTKELFFAQKGKGAWLLNDSGQNRLQVAESMQLQQELLIVRDIENSFQENKTKLHTGTGLSKVARGDLQACLYGVAHRGSPKAWDFAPFDLIITEAGGRVSDQKGSNISYLDPELDIEAIIASNSAVHQELIDKLNYE